MPNESNQEPEQLNPRDDPANASQSKHGSKRYIVLTVAVGVLIIGVVWVMRSIGFTAGPVQSSFEERKSEFETKMNSNGKAVFVIKDIPAGTIITKESLLEREILQIKIPQDAVPSADLAAGRLAKYDISVGMIMCQHDLGPGSIKKTHARPTK